MRQRGVGDGLQALDRRRPVLGLLARRLGRHEPLALLLLAQAVADVRQARVEHPLAVALDDPDHRLAAQPRAVGTVDRDAHREVPRAGLAGALEQRAAALVEALVLLDRDPELLKRHAEQLRARAAEQRLGGGVDVEHAALRVGGDEAVAGAVDDQARALLARAQRALLAGAALDARAHLVQQARDQQPDHERRAEDEHEADRRVRRVVDAQHDPVRDPDEREVRERRRRREEVERVQRRPHVDQRVQRRLLGVVDDQAQQQRHRGEGRDAASPRTARRCRAAG